MLCTATRLTSSFLHCLLVPNFPRRQVQAFSLAGHLGPDPELCRSPRTSGPFGRTLPLRLFSVSSLQCAVKPLGRSFPLLCPSLGALSPLLPPRAGHSDPPPGLAILTPASLRAGHSDSAT